MHTKALGDRALIWVASFDGPSAFPATLLILYFCCVLVRVVAMWKINSLSPRLLAVFKGAASRKGTTGKRQTAR